MLCRSAKVERMHSMGRLKAARQHSQQLQEIRGTGPLISGLLGIHFCVGCCQVQAHQRMSAEQAASHAFILSCRTWNAAIELVGDIAPVLEHMLPGDVRGHGSHECKH